MLTLLGFTLTTICATICPMGMNMDMGTMSMSHGDMQMMHDDMAQKEQKTPCEKCNQKVEEVAAVTMSTIEIHMPMSSLLSVIPVFSYDRAASLRQSIRLVHSYIRPPPPAETLVGTVILLT